MEFSRSTLIAAYPIATCAWRVLQNLMDADYSQQQIGVVTRNQAALRARGLDDRGLPASGPVLAGGLFGAVLARCGVGTATGRLFGSLIALGMTKEEALFLLEVFQDGRTILAVRYPERSEEALAILGSEASDFLWSRHFGARLESAASVA